MPPGAQEEKGDPPSHPPTSLSLHFLFFLQFVFFGMRRCHQQQSKVKAQGVEVAISTKPLHFFHFCRSSN